MPQNEADIERGDYKHTEYEAASRPPGRPHIVDRPYLWHDYGHAHTYHK
jgi:hypothetical protein